MRPNLICFLVVSSIAVTSIPAAELSIGRDAGAIALSWPSDGSNRVYTLQQSTDLSKNRWTPVAPWDQWPIADLGFRESFDSGVARFFRLATIERGRVVAVTSQATFSKQVLNLLVLPTLERTYGIDIPFQAEHNVEIYRVDYETLDPLLGSVIASGAVCLPTDLATPADVLSYQHGTIYRRDEAPSDPSTDERYVGVILASHGYATVMPDLLGLGTGSTGLHPYVHRRASATAVVDLMRALRSLAATHPRIHSQLSHGLSSKLFLFGYSEGGYATAAAQREIQERHASEFAITASAPCAGPYDLSGVMADIMTSNVPYGSPSYLPYVLFAYNEIYHLFDDPAEVLIQPYAATLPPLFDGQHTGDEIDAAMPASGIPSAILQPSFLAAFKQDPNHPFRRILEENDLTGWAPANPTRLYHCGSDSTVPVANSQVAYASFLAAGADPARVQLIDPDPSGTHSTCLYSAVPLISVWFDSLR